MTNSYILFIVIPFELSFVGISGPASVIIIIPIPNTISGH